MMISVAFIAAVFVSNIPQALAPSAELAPDIRFALAPDLMMWGAVVVACGVAAGLGYAVADAFGATECTRGCLCGGRVAGDAHGLAHAVRV